MSEQIDRIRSKLDALVADGGPNAEQAQRILGKLPGAAQTEPPSTIRDQLGPGSVDTAPPGPLYGYQRGLGDVTASSESPGELTARESASQENDLVGGLVANGAAMNAPLMLLGKMGKFGAGKLLASKGGQAAETIARAARQPAQMSLPTYGGGSMAEPVSAELAAARQAMKFKLMPSGASMGAAALLGGADFGHFAPLAIAGSLAARNAAPIAGRMAPIARKVMSSPLETDKAALLFQAAMGARNAAP